MAFTLIELPYYTDSSLLFNKLHHLPWSVYLDSCQPYSQQGRYDIMTALPYLKLISKGEQTFVYHNDDVEISTENPFSLLKEKLGLPSPTIENIPFAGGALGYFAYDLARRIEQLPCIACADIDIPEMTIGIYDWAIVVDHHLQKTSLVSYQRDSHTPLLLTQLLDYLQNNNDTVNLIERTSDTASQSFQLLSPFQSNLTKLEYAQAFQHIQAYLQAGDCYQVNLAQRFTANYSGSTWEAYRELRKNNAAPYAAYLNYADYSILSLSPERFLSCRNGKVESKPIKGTRPRGTNTKQDQQLATELLQSAKDRAENLMIVDLLRNDLGKSCTVGSITVSNLFSLESFPAVHHMVSTVQGELAKDKHSLDLLRDCFPGGSITGAPKLRAMEIIEELEPQRRSVYCGALGYIGFNGAMDVNIAIRTLLATQGQLHCYAGGGVVSDSTLEAEYQETQDKVTKILRDIELISP
ncbi:aminodeoxychorismate synthase component 1 [soil metagenome]